MDKVNHANNKKKSYIRQKTFHLCDKEKKNNLCQRNPFYFSSSRNVSKKKNITVQKEKIICHKFFPRINV